LLLLPQFEGIPERWLLASRISAWAEQGIPIRPRRG